MKAFGCPCCGQLLFFENALCERCGHALGFQPETSTLHALVFSDDGLHTFGPERMAVKRCANAEYGICNWLLPAGSPDFLCTACRLNRTIPDISQPANRTLWARLEEAKHRLVYGLLRLGLAIRSRQEDPYRGLAFDFLSAAAPAFRETGVITGHAQGLITIDIAEADEVARTRHREYMAEPYRTVLGHFRHEIGHFYWERLIRDRPPAAAFRSLFGDENRDYAAALADHYAAGPPPDWQQRYVSAYASAHPWEDWAETWAHYMHIVDTLETAHAFGITVAPRAGTDPGLTAAADFDPYREDDFDTLMRPWLPLVYAANSLNRGMGQPDLYPFVIAPTVADKLRFVHGLIAAERRG